MLSQSHSCNVSLTVQLIDAQVLVPLIYCSGINLNRGILTPHLSVGTQSRSTDISDLISVQDKVLDTAVQTLLKADVKNAASAETATVFPVGSYVFCRYTDRPPTRLYTKWHVPYCIVSFKGSEYVLANLVNHKKRSVHVKNLKIFNFDSEVDVPADTARPDYLEFVVEKVLGHAGDTRNRQQCCSMLNGSTTRTLIIHGNCGNHCGSVKHPMII